MGVARKSKSKHPAGRLGRVPKKYRRSHKTGGRPKKGEVRAGLGGCKKRRRESVTHPHEDVPNTREGEKRGNFAIDLSSPTEPKGFPNGLTAGEKEWIMQDGLRMFCGDEEMARRLTNSVDEQTVGNLWTRMAWEKFGREWFDACEADESILYYEHPQPNHDKWYLRLRDRETVVQDNGMYEITTITEYGHEADEYRATKKMPAGATECEWAGRKYALHNYSPPPDHVDSTKEISFKMHLKCLWDVVDAAWNVMCDEVDVRSDADVRRFLYRPGRIMHMSEPECWHDDEDGDPNDRKYDRETTIQAAKEFGGNLLGLMMKHFEGADHVRLRITCGCDWPEDWTDKRKEEYSEAFKEVVDKQCEVREGRSWSLIPILHDKRTRVVDMIVDRIGGFLKCRYDRYVR